MGGNLINHVDAVTEYLQWVQNDTVKVGTEEDKLKDEMKKENVVSIKRGDKARVVKGPFRGDEGKVVAVDEEAVAIETSDGGEVSVGIEDVKKI
jgi:transcription antitermination factor NusG